MKEPLKALLQTIGDRVCDLFDQMERGLWKDDMGHLVRDNTAMVAMKGVLTEIMIFRSTHLDYDKVDRAVLERRLMGFNQAYAGKQYRHVKTGDLYVISSFEYREADMNTHFTYHPDGQPFLKFSRPLAELSRFEVMP